MNHQTTDGERQLIELLRHAPMTVNQMVEKLGVTANAVRQRLGTLMAGQLVSRQKSSGRTGRPSHTYELTKTGKRTAGNNFPDLAKALWVEIQAIQDPKVRQNVMAGAFRRLLESYDGQVSGESLADRLESVREFFEERNIPIAIEQQQDLPVLRVLECPYPDLVDADHQFCELEKRLFEKVIGSPVQLCQCRKDGDGCCSFQAIEPSLPE